MSSIEDFGAKPLTESHLRELISVPEEKRVAAVHLAALKRKGFIESDAGKARSLRITSPLQKLRGRIMDIPLFGTIPVFKQSIRRGRR